MRSPKTTTVAILAIIAGAAKALYSLLAGEGIPNTEDIVLVLSGVGFLFARDNDRTDAESGAQVAEQNRSIKKSQKTDSSVKDTLPHGPRL